MSHDDGWLVRGGTVITMDGDRRVFEDGAVAVIGDRIAEVGEFDAMAERYEQLRRFELAGSIVMPGLIDAHGHAGHSFTRTIGLHSPGVWARACEEVYTRASDPEMWRLDGFLLALDRLRCGVTTGGTFLGGGGDILTGDMAFRTDGTECADAHAQAVTALGVREVLVVGPRRPPFPRPYVQWRDGTPHDVSVSFEDQLSVCERVAERWDGAAGDRIRVAFTSHTVHPAAADPHADAMAAQTRRVLSAARGRGLQFMQDGHTCGSVAAIAHLLGPDVLLSHATELTDDELALCASSGCTVIHNPSAIASSLGRCPAPELLDRGARVVIASDGGGPDRGCDLLRHLFVAMRLQRAALRDPSVLPEPRAFELVTLDAAAALGRSSELGVLQTGAQADLVVLDGAAPHLTPLVMPVEQVVGFASGGDVHSVMVAGELVLHDRRVTTVDEADVLARARACAQTTFSRAGLEGDSVRHDPLARPLEEVA